jgi:DNA mismatch repair protein MutS
MASTHKMTPMMKQYFEMKEKHSDAILLYRMGDFYETFNEDAKTVSKVLGIALTKRGGEDATPLAGFPYHSLDTHLPKLLSAGYKVARCEQIEDPKTAKGVVKRDVVEVNTPGSTLSEKVLDHRSNNYIISIDYENNLFGLAIADVSTGELIAFESGPEQLKEQILNYNVREVLTAKSNREQIEAILKNSYSGLISSEDNWFYDQTFTYDLLINHFKTHSLKGFGLEEKKLAITACGALLNYLKSNYKNDLSHFHSIQSIDIDNVMNLDQSTRRNLEILQTIHDNRKNATLISILDKTNTPMGARLLRKWISQPLINLIQIQKRHNLVEELVNNEDFSDNLRKILSEIGDLERILGRVATGRSSPKDLLFLKNGLCQIKPITECIYNIGNKNWISIAEQFHKIDHTIQLIEDSISEQAPHLITEGNIIKQGYHAELDELKNLSSEGKNFIIELQKTERDKTGISSLKVNFNKVFGYYIEITNTHKDKVPESYIRKQTLVNSERYITDELKKYEEKVLGAEEKINEIEYRLFHEIRERVAKDTSIIQENSKVIAYIDCLVSLAIASKENSYNKPLMYEGTELFYKNGRHPVVEKNLDPGTVFTVNSCQIDTEKDQIMIITGPNMAGKSTFLRQTGLIVLMAQIGCFVPADEAKIGVVDRIFTRVGASDNLASGESTFLVEMNEAANILNNTTENSLILFDELGRGTSTFDGLSIAWSVLEYLHINKEKAAKTLFATHYHELTELEMLFPRIKNFNVAVEELDDKVIFLRKIIPGGTDNSYGIQVAKMAGLPKQVIERAKEILENLEANELNPNTQKPNIAKRHRGRDVDQNQTSLFGSFSKNEPSEVEEKLKNVHIENLTPLEALNKLNELKKLIKS